MIISDIKEGEEMTARELKKILDSISEKDLNSPVILEQRGAILQRAVSAEVGFEYIENTHNQTNRKLTKVFRIRSNH